MFRSGTCVTPRSELCSGVIIIVLRYVFRCASFWENCSLILVQRSIKERTGRANAQSTFVRTSVVKRRRGYARRTPCPARHATGSSLCRWRTRPSSRRRLPHAHAQAWVQCSDGWTLFPAPLFPDRNRAGTQSMLRYSTSDAALSSPPLTSTLPRLQLCFLAFYGDLLLSRRPSTLCATLDDDTLWQRRRRCRSAGVIVE